MIGIVDYGLGNVRAFDNIYRRLGVPAQPVRDADELSAAERLILPGVGAFDWAMLRLRGSGMLDALNARVLDDAVPVLGVCVGMQIMGRSSDEGVSAGLGWIPGHVTRLKSQSSDGELNLPHMGWNDVDTSRGEPLFADIFQPQFYFLHSYYFCPDKESSAISTTSYGIDFASAVRRNNIWGTQFHPEKSHHWGIQLLRNFAGIS